MRYQQLFERTRSEDRLAYIPFLVVGDPTEGDFLALVDRVVDNGADALELGFAFSDPVADGPAIQQAALRPLTLGFSIEQAFEAVAKVRSKYPELPIGLLTYANLLMAKKIDGFYEKSQACGIDSILIADCPVQESALFAGAAKRFGIQSVFIAPPDASDETLQLIAEKSEGYTYVLSRKGITGTEVEAPQAATGFIDTLKRLQSAPLVQGFGISAPEHVYAAKKAGVDGIITGSAIVKLINQHYNEPQKMLDEVGAYAKTMATAAHQN